MPLKVNSTLTFDFSPERVSGAFFEGVKFEFSSGKDKLAGVNLSMNTPEITLQNPTPAQAKSWASSQALAILAVDGIRPSSEGVVLMQSIDAGTMTHAQAIQSIIERARS
jgi:hypothetical protein